MIGLWLYIRGRGRRHGTYTNLLLEVPLFTIIPCYYGYNFYKRIGRNLNPQSFVSELCWDVIMDLQLQIMITSVFFPHQQLNLGDMGSLECSDTEGSQL